MKTEIECVKVFNIAKNKVYWQYRCGDTIIDANQSDPETERAIVAMFKQKFGVRPREYSAYACTDN